MLDRWFGLTAQGTNVRREVIGGITTFLAMVYIIFVNPQILAAAGMDQDSVFVATCLTAAAGSLIMGIYANYPIALAPGMGLNAYFAYTVVGAEGLSWQVGLGAVFIASALFFIVSVLPIRRWIIEAIPTSQKLAFAAGIGLLLVIIALENAAIIVNDPATLVTVGDFSQTGVLLACLGFVVIVALDARKVPGAIIIGVLAVTVLSVLLGASEFKGVLAAPPGIGPTFLELDLVGAIDIGAGIIIFTLLLVTLFDNTGTLLGVAREGGFVDAQGRIPRVRRALASDGAGAMVGALLGTSTTTSYVESAAGIRAGGRTGLTAVVVAILFLASLFLAPLAGTIPIFATAPAVLFVGCVMTRGVTGLDWEDVTEFVPAIITVAGIPLTFSISTGIGLGFISYVAVKVLSGRYREVSPGMLFVGALFVLEFALR